MINAIADALDRIAALEAALAAERLLADNLAAEFRRFLGEGVRREPESLVRYREARGR